MYKIHTLTTAAADVKVLGGIRIMSLSGRYYKSICLLLSLRFGETPQTPVLLRGVSQGLLLYKLRNTAKRSGHTAGDVQKTPQQTGKSLTPSKSLLNELVCFITYKHYRLLIMDHL